MFEIISARGSAASYHVYIATLEETSALTFQVKCSLLCMISISQYWKNLAVKILIRIWIDCRVSQQATSILSRKDLNRCV